MSQKGFVSLVAVGIILAFFAVGYFLVNKSTPKDNISDWEIYKNPINNYSFLYPKVDYEIDDSDPSGEGYAPNGEFGNFVYKTDTGLVFSVEVISTPEWSTIGNVAGDRDALEKVFKEGGIEEVAKLSQEINLQPEENFPNEEVSELKTFSYKNGTGYGFTMTGVFNSCFNNEIKCESGEVLTFVPPYDKFHINGPWAIVYVTDGKNIYLIKFPVNSIASQILSTFKFLK